MSVDIETAIKVGKRRDHKPKILKVYASEACNQGIKFYQGNDKVWLVDFISPRYIIVD